MCIKHFKYYFGAIEDKRYGNRKVHPLINILFITLVGMLSGLNPFVEIEEFGKARVEFLKKYLDLSNGIPSHDTLGNVFALIDSEHFAECFDNWSLSLRTLIKEDFVALDGKSTRSSLDKNKNKLPIHLMNVWSSMNSICLAQMRCDGKSNKIIAFEKLLEKLSLDECTITADAIHCHKETTRQIIKDENKHGRQEQRTIDFFKTDSCIDDIFDGWHNINGFIRIKAARGIRYHWQIENNLHWVLDNTFSEDRCCVRCKNASENLAYIRKIALNVLNKNKTPKISMKRMMLKALLNEKYLETLMDSF